MVYTVYMRLLINLDEELRQKLEKMSNEKKVSMASFIRTLILEADSNNNKQTNE